MEIDRVYPFAQKRKEEKMQCRAVAYVKRSSNNGYVLPEHYP